MRELAPIFTLFLLTSIFSTAQNPKTTYGPVPIKATREPNPVPATPESIAEGKRIYGYDCASCHGATGDGKTAAAKNLKMPNLTSPDLKNHTDGELCYVIKNGHGDMPAEGDRVKPEQLWDLVNYVRTFPKNEPVANTKP
jgi:mono/diheme cytochrome c family protein